MRDYEAQAPKEALTIDVTYHQYLPELIEIVEETENFDDLDGEKIQALMFIIPKKYELNQGQWFKFLYSVLLGKERGPRLGPFLSILGQKVVLSMLKKTK